MLHTSMDSFKLFLEQNEEQLDGIGSKCPVCSARATMRCKCPLGDTFCPNGHTWHTCPEHNVVVVGPAHNNKNLVLTREFKVKGCSCHLHSETIGGPLGPPSANTNTGLPVRSKISTNNGSDKFEPEAAVNPDDLFGFKGTTSKNRTRERRASFIDRDSKRVPRERIPPDIIY